ncbi:hypothetical protein ACFY97_10160 [Streptomyces klenkii]
MPATVETDTPEVEKVDSDTETPETPETGDPGDGDTDTAEPLDARDILAA